MATYRLLAGLPLSYTFTGEARSAIVTLADNTRLALVPMSKNGSRATFKPSGMTPVPSNVTFVRARLISSGAPGLEPAIETLAGQLALRFTDGTNNSEPFMLSFTKYNEWEQQMVSAVTGECEGDSIRLELIARDSMITLDDYNVQEAYVGQDVEPILEIEVECSGINVE